MFGFWCLEGGKNSDFVKYTKMVEKFRLVFIFGFVEVKNSLKGVCILRKKNCLENIFTFYTFMLKNNNHVMKFVFFLRFGFKILVLRFGFKILVLTFGLTFC